MTALHVGLLAVYLWAGTAVTAGAAESHGLRLPALYASVRRHHGLPTLVCWVGVAAVLSVAFWPLRLPALARALWRPAPLPTRTPRRLYPPPVDLGQQRVWPKPADDPDPHYRKAA